MAQKKLYKEDFILKNNCIDWEKSKNRKFRVEYDNKIYNLTYIGKKDNNHIIVNYNNKEYFFTRSSILNAQIGKIVGSTNYGFLHNVGEVINNRLILEQIKKNKNNTYEKCYKVRCIKDNYEYYITEIMLKNDCKCPVCCNRILVKGINDLQTSRPDIAKMLYDKSEGYKYLCSSKHKTSWICQCCGSVVHGKSIYNVCKNNTVYCPFCHDGFSYPEKLMNSILTNFDIEYDYHYSFKDQYFEYDNKPYHPIYDFYFTFNNTKYIIEMDGGFHYIETNCKFKYSLKQLQEIDKLKDKLAFKNGCKIIRIDCRKSNYNYIINSLKNSILSKIMNFDSLDYHEINKYACSSKIKKVCELYMNKTKSVDEISEISKSSIDTIYKYLRIGSKLGLCNYKEDAYLNKLRGVVCVNTGKYYKSITSASNDTNIRISLIFGCCKHDYFTAGSDENSNPLVWMYEEEYQELINNNVNIDDYVNNQINKRWQVLSKKVICLNTLEVFEAKNASEWCGVSKDCIYSCCRGRTKTSGKNPETGERLKWMYYDDFIKLSQEEQNIISIH